MKNKMISLFDSLAHPTLTGNWLHDKYHQEATFEKLVEKLQKSNFKKACAIGMAGIEGYNHAIFIKKCNEYTNYLVPIAGFDPSQKTALELLKELDLIADLGYKGIKIHPRFSKIDLSTNNLVTVFKAAAERNLVVFYCTYTHCHLDHYSVVDPFYHLIHLLKQTTETKIILVHGGDIQLLRYAELVRFNPNLLLDLSLTMMKYKGSSVDQDIRFLFQQFDRRICIGTDFPEYTYQAVYQRFVSFSEGITLKKKINIAYQNLQDFLELKTTF